MVRNRNTLPLRSSTVAISTTTVAPITTSENPKTTPRVFRRKLISRTPPLSRRTQQVTAPSSTTTTSTQIPAIYSNESIDDEVASILPALTSAKPRKPSFSFDVATKAITTIQPTFIDTSTSKPTTTFDQILQHQYKIKGLDKDYEDEKFERYENHQGEDEKLIGVLGSQVNF